MIKFLLACTDAMDETLQLITKGHRPVYIWSDMEEEDAAILVDAAISAGKQYKRAAMAYRAAIVMSYRYEAVKILLPRTARTIYYLFTNGVSLK